MGMVFDSTRPLATPHRVYDYSGNVLDPLSDQLRDLSLSYGRTVDAVHGPGDNPVSLFQYADIAHSSGLPYPAVDRSNPGAGLPPPLGSA